MSALTDDYLAAIAEHSAGFADDARDNLQARVEHCPAWSVADLVWHLTEVHWFWGTIAADRLAAPPDDSLRPPRPADTALVDDFLAGARRLVDILRPADPSQRVWTWAPHQQDIAFISRHQVQETVVHHWDAANAAGRPLEIAVPVAVDAIDEFLTFSVSSEADPAEPPRPPLRGTFVLRATDQVRAPDDKALTGSGTWTLTDGHIPGTVEASVGAQDDVPVVAASASDLLLWLYGRVDLDTGPVDDELFGRFRALCFTD